MRIPALAAVALVVLGGCTPSMQSTFEKGCAAVTTAYALFSTQKDSGRFSQATIRRVDAAWAIADPLCKHPPTDAASASLQVASILVIVTRAINAEN